MSEPLDRLPPQNPEAEEAVLGSLLMDPEAVGKVADSLTPGDFYRERNGAIFAAALALARRHEPVDFVTVSDELQRSGHYEEIGGLAYLHELVGRVPTAVHVERYAEIVRRCSVRRRLISAAGHIAGLAYDDSNDLDGTLARAAELVAGAQAGGKGGSFYSPEDQARILVDMLAEWDDAKGAPPGLPSSLPRFNRLTGGYRPECLYVIGACTGVGKTAFLGTEARYLRSKGHKVLFASSEMGVDDLVRRNVAAMVGRDWNEVDAAARAGRLDDFTSRKLADALERLPAVSSYVYDNGGMTVDRIRRHAARLKANGGLDAVVVDYLQRLNVEAWQKNRYLDVDNIAKGLKSLAMELHLPVIVAAQFNLGRVEERPLYFDDKKGEVVDKREPDLNDFRESGGIANEADVAMGLHRRSLWMDSADQGEAWLHVLKNRHGIAPRRIRLNWRPELTVYDEWAEGR